MTVVEEYFAEIIKIILSMTFMGSAIAFFLFILKPIIKNKLPKSFLYYMWFSVIIALMLPVSKIIVIPISYNSVIPMKSMYDITQWISDTVFEKSTNLVFTPQNENTKNVLQVTGFSNAAVILVIFWQLVMILILGFNSICYVSYARRLSKHNISAERQEIKLLNDLLKGKNSLQLYKNSIVKTPILIGFFRPAIILPDKKYEDIKLRNILMHEIAHMKRCDIAIKWLLIFIGAVHWFNPLVYLVRREMNKACELACDEFVIKRFDISEKQQYGDTLIAVAADSIKKMPRSITMFEDKENLKERLGAIMKYKKHSKKIIIIASAVLVAVVCTILGFSTLHGIENEHSYADNSHLPQYQKYMKEIELRDVLRNYDENSIAEAYVFLGDLDGEITNAYINIISYEKTLNSEMQNGIKYLVAEELQLDIQNVYVDYMDLESFTSY